MRLVAGIATACTLAAIGAVPAHAAKAKPAPAVCKLIFDDEADYTVPDGDASVDIVGGDFASNGKQITGIIRLKGLTNPNPRSPLGQAYFIEFTVKGSSDILTLSAGLYPTGNQFGFGYQGPDPVLPINTSYTLGEAKGVIAGNEIRITADIAKFPQAKLLKNGNKVTTLEANARRVYGQRAVPSQQVGPVRAPLGGLTLNYDDATGKTYTLGARSCVAVGK